MSEQLSKRTHLGGIALSHLSLATLAVQNAGLILVMHYSRVQPIAEGSSRYLTSTAVFLNEVIKLSLSLGFAVLELSGPGSTWSTVLSHLKDQVFSSDSWKLAIPAALYTFQNTLQYVAVSNLDAATFQVTYQMKILTTAIFSVIMLNRSLSYRKWISLFLLMFGIGVVQLPATSGPSTSAVADKDMNAFVGLVAVCIACVLSGLAGVYFEKVLKGSGQVNLWVRNIQLSFYSLFPAALTLLFKDGAAVQASGFFEGYNAVVWAAVILQAVGGLLVALVVQYSDNIAKNFATSISIVISFVVSVWLFDFTITVPFVAGMCIVMYATYLYSSPEPRPKSWQAVETFEDGEESEGSSFHMDSDLESVDEKV